MNFIKKYEHRILSDMLRFLGTTIKWGIHKNGYWLSNLNYSYDYILSNFIINYFKKENVKNVIDIGCGEGYYVNELNFHKINCIGIDGNLKLLNILKNENLYCLDVTSEFLIPDLLEKIKELKKLENLKNKQIKEKTIYNINNFIFDYVICLNVGEYIPKNKEKYFIKNLDRLNKDGIILLWDTPGIYNIGTINEKKENEILEIFCNNLNYFYDKDISNIFRNNCYKSIYILKKKKKKIK